MGSYSYVVKTAIYEGSLALRPERKTCRKVPAHFSQVHRLWSYWTENLSKKEINVPGTMAIIEPMLPYLCRDYIQTRDSRSSPTRWRSSSRAHGMMHDVMFISGCSTTATMRVLPNQGQHNVIIETDYRRVSLDITNSPGLKERQMLTTENWTTFKSRSYWQSEVHFNTWPYKRGIDGKVKYYQVSMAPDDRKKTAFYGSYKFKWMPFGLNRGPNDLSASHGCHPGTLFRIYLCRWHCDL